MVKSDHVIIIMAPIKRHKRTHSGSSKGTAVVARSIRNRAYAPLYRRVASPVPTKMHVKLLYHDQVAITPSTGQAGSHVFRANDLYDPDATGVGHQPRGFDQLMALYDHFVVVGSRIRVIFDCRSTTGANVGGIRLSDTLTPSTSVDYQMESSYKVVGAQPEKDGGQPLVLSMSSNPAKYLGREDPLSDPQLKGSSSGSPTEGAFYHVFSFATHTSETPATSYASVQIEYSAYLIEPTMPSVS